MKGRHRKKNDGWQQEVRREVGKTEERKGWIKGEGESGKGNGRKKNNKSVL